MRQVARLAWEDTLNEKVLDIPEIIVPGKKATMRCCVYKERAILARRVKLALSTGKKRQNIINVIDIACDECPVGGYDVTNACRGCLAHRCEDVCKFGAITFDSQQKAVIDKEKCKECGACAKVCPFGAITNRNRPCQNACKIKAISMDENKVACIDSEKCTSCGACVYQCPFGAITDSSYILDVIDIIKKSENNTKYKVHAVIAPAFFGQFVYATPGQVITGIKKLGFADVTEAALGADMVAQDEAKELAEKGFLISSCCPAFVTLVNNNFPSLKDKISQSLSPMATVAKYIKQKDPDSKVVFIGPCTAKKEEVQKDKVKPYVDSAITFEELQALFDSREMEISSFEESELENASGFGRGFAKCGGLSGAVAQSLKEQGIKDFELKAVSCDGTEECRATLLKASKNALNANFIEGMACTGGCVGGAGCLTHTTSSRNTVDNYVKNATKKTIKEAVKQTKE